MPYRLIYHRIQNKRFSVYKIINVNVRRRLFCILDQDKPYVLDITYEEKHETFKYNSIIGSFDNHHGWLFRPDKFIDPTTDYEFRFSTENECVEHSTQIEEKQQLIDRLINNKIKK